MNCIICSGRMVHHFRKLFDMYDLGEVDYSRCIECGFSASKTHFDLSADAWKGLNFAFHTNSEARQDNPYNRNQRYFNQALMLHLLKRSGIVNSGAWLDWGSGSGALSWQLQHSFDIKLQNFDKFMTPSLHRVFQDELEPRGYSLVANTAVFEHIRDRATLDEIESYVEADGCLAVHTLVRGEIPADPDWMYLLPIHCAFHTNRSMSILMEQWGYTCSLYNEHAKMWVWFKRAPSMIKTQVGEINTAMGWEYLHFKEGFMDYWP